MCTESICVLLLYIALYFMSKGCSDGIEHSDTSQMYTDTSQHIMASCGSFQFKLRTVFLLQIVRELLLLWLKGIVKRQACQSNSKMRY
jgi:hypothetical protein